MREPSYYLRQVLQAKVPQYVAGGTLLDVGCGRAKYRHFLEHYCERYIGLDNGSSQFQFGGMETIKLDLIADVLHLPIRSDHFNSVLCTQVMEHVPHPWLLLAEIARVLKPGGVAIIASPWLVAYHPEPLDYYRYTSHAYRALAEACGLEPLEIVAQGGAFSGLLALVTRMVEMHHPAVQKMLTKRFVRIPYRLLELLADKLDPLWSGEDCLGHLFIARKPAP